MKTSMKTLEEANKAILTNVISDDAEVRGKYLDIFGPEVNLFSIAMAKAFINWRSLDDKIENNEKLAYVSALVFTAINLHIISMKLFLGGFQVASGNILRQVIETISLSLLCSNREIGILESFTKRKYNSNNAIKDLKRNKKKLNLTDDGLRSIETAQIFYHKFSHPTQLSVGTGVSFSNDDLMYIGSCFDEGKIDFYRKEMDGRIALAKIFDNFIDGVKANIEKW